MTPSSSRSSTRRWQGVGERPTRSARSTIGSRPSAGGGTKMRLSISSSSVIEFFSHKYHFIREYIQTRRQTRPTSPGFAPAAGRYIQAMDSLVPIANLRGDYSGMAADWTVPQQLGLYSAEDQAVWRLLVERQTALAERHACPEFLAGLRTLGIGETIPDFDAVNARLEKLTGWRVVGVPGLIPDATFYDHLAHRRFPVTVWIRKRSEIDYLVEPDLFHDFFGHVPLLGNPMFADYMQLYGQPGVEPGTKIDLLARLYWYRVEFGL